LGTEASSYLIANKEDLLELAATIGDYNKHFLMTADIDLSGTNFTKAVIATHRGSSNYSFSGYKFSGVFDGNGKRIVNLSIDGGTTNHFVGLFGYIDSGAEIKNLGITDCNVSGGEAVGTLFGDSYDSVVLNCYSTGTVSGSAYVGGLCGGNRGDLGMISNCYSSGSVIGSSNGDYVGGLVGQNRGNGDIISECYSVGKVVGIHGGGGLCGSNHGIIDTSFWDTEMSGISYSDGGIGRTTVEMQTKSTFTDANWDFVNTWQMNSYPVPRGPENYGLHALDVQDGSGSGVYESGVEVEVDVSTNIFSLVKWVTFPLEYTNNVADVFAASTTFIMPGTSVNLTPILDCYSGGDGTEDNPYILANKADLLALRLSTDHYDRSFNMIADIDLENEVFADAVIAPYTTNSFGYPNPPGFEGSFEGSFDGNGKTIMNLTIEGSSSNDYYVGLFGSISDSGTIRNINIKDCNIRGGNRVGGLCGYNNGYITSCSSTRTIVKCCWQSLW
jgi:hypothetical protein